MAKEDTWKKLENLENIIDLVKEFEKKIREKEIERIWMRKEKKRVLNSETEVFKRSKLLGKYMIKILFGWNNRKFEDKYLKKLDKMKRERKTSFSKGRTLREILLWYV